MVEACTNSIFTRSCSGHSTSFRYLLQLYLDVDLLRFVCILSTSALPSFTLHSKSSSSLSSSFFLSERELESSMMFPSMEFSQLNRSSRSRSISSGCSPWRTVSCWRCSLHLRMVALA